MASTLLLKPALYRREGTPQAPNHPALLGGQCVCGYVFFPMQHYGCERCGRTDLSPRPLSGQGTLVAAVRVHAHFGKHREAPFSVASVLLDDGPMVRSLILTEEKMPESGTRIVTALVPVKNAEGVEHLDLRFIPAKDGDAQ